jgi:hypothetical protein
VELITHFDALKAAALKRKSSSDIPTSGGRDSSDLNGKDRLEAVANDAIYLAGRVEKGLVKMVSAGGPVSEVDRLKDEVSRLKKLLNQKTKEP